jgi:hypothetical protein
MRKFILYKLAGLALLLVSIVACETAEQEVSPTVSPGAYPVATFTPADSYSALTEGDTVVYTVTTDKLIARAMTFNAKILEGTIDDHDIKVMPGVLAPYTNSTTIKVIFLKDWDVEETETVKFEFGIFGVADRYLLNQSVVNPTLDLTVANYVSDVLTSEYGWYTEYNVINYVTDSVLVGWDYVLFEDTVIIATDSAYEMDFEVLVSDATGFDISDPWASNVLLGAQTGDNPELIDIVGLSDGEYVAWTDLSVNYTEPDYDAIEDPTIKAPVVAHFTRQGTAMDVTVDQPLSQAPTIDIDGYWGDYIGGASEPFYGIIAYIIVADGKYTIKELDGTTDGPWKTNANRTPRPAKYNKTTFRR